MAQIAVYEISGVSFGVQVLLPGKKWAENPLEIGEHGRLTIPSGLQPSGFHLVLFTEKGSRTVIVQKNVGKENGGYFRHALAQIGRQEDEMVIWMMYDPINVMRPGDGKVWTDWHAVKPNRVDCWHVAKDGMLQLWQTGVITHDNGRTFQLLVEPRWQGQILKTSNGELVAKPNNEKWGALLWNPNESRAAIREYPGFQHILADAEIASWNGSPEELNPPLGPIPVGDYARADWYIPFAGQNGQGIAKLRDGSPVWVHGQDLAVPADEDGIVRLYHNDLLTFVGINKNWGTKKDSPPKLLGVRKI